MAWRTAKEKLPIKLWGTVLPNLLGLWGGTFRCVCVCVQQVIKHGGVSSGRQMEVGVRGLVKVGEVMNKWVGKC